jgi:pyrroloquinoline quinone biosynthesis protein D
VAILKRNPDVHWRVEAHREEKAMEVLADPERTSEDGDMTDLGTVTLLSGGVMHQLNLLGAEIWKLCDGTRDRGQILRELLDVFEVDEGTLKQDLEAFLDDMIGRGLIHEKR